MRLALLAILLAVALAGASCGEKHEPEATALVTTTTTARTSTTGDEPPRHGEAKPADGKPSPAERAAKRRRAAERTVTAYVEALDARDGAAVCRLLAEGALDGVKLPRQRGSCAASLDASIGYRDPRGLPQFAGVRLAQLVTTDEGPDSARATATLVTAFADRDQPSIEDDVIYLTRAGGGGFRVAKASVALYRAIGAADIPPDVISPPR